MRGRQSSGATYDSPIGPSGASRVDGSLWSSPVATSSIAAQSATSLAIQPTVSNDQLSGYTPYRDTRPNVGLKPTTPL